jgi:hypothetical protein
VPNFDPWLPPGTDPVPLNMAGVYCQVVNLTKGVVLDNVMFLDCTQSMGDDPGMASFAYVFQDNGDPTAPQSFEQALDASFSLPKTVAANDIVQVSATRPDGVTEVLFIGYALDFGMVAEGETEEVHFYAQGLARSLWDTPVGGQYLRDATAPKTGNGIQTDLVAAMNPRIIGGLYGNATPVGGDRTVGGFAYPVFLEPLIHPSNVSSRPRRWTLAMAIKYLIYHHNSAQTIVQNPLASDLDALLVAREPSSGQVFDLTDPTTYTTSDIQAPNTPMTGRAWPQLVHDFLRDKGFGMTFRTETSGGSASTRLDLFILQAGPLKDVWLQPPGSALDPRFSNVGAARVGRDLRQVVNSWNIDGALVRYEGSFVLAPMFPMASADGATSSAINAFDKSGTGYQTGTAKRDAYRLYAYDETGDGHYAPGTNTAITTPGDFTDLFGTGSYAKRRRPARGDLITRDDKGVPYRYRLDYSTNYTGPSPGRWNGTGTWKPVTGGFAVCDDRLGIRVTVENPNSWSVGDDPTTNAPVVLKGIEAQCAVAVGKNFTLRLTAVIEGDFASGGYASKTSNSPLAQTIERRIDARDRYASEVVDGGSVNNTATTDLVSRNDGDLALAEAIQNRTATEAGVLDGQIEIPYITTSFRIGDRIRGINGRGLGFRTDGGGPSSTPVYPLVVGRRITNSPRQSTLLIVSDESETRTTTRARKRSTRR